MRAAFIIALFAWAAASRAVPEGEELDHVTGQLKPHEVHDIDLAELIDQYQRNDTNALAKRTAITVCSYRTHIVANRCKTVGAGITDYTGRLAVQLKTSSDVGDCGHQTYYGEAWNWDKHASNVDPENGDCTTDAQQSTIDGALQWYFVNEGTICNVRCLRLKHGDGTWRGFVSWTNYLYNAANYACGPHSATNCYTGGSNDCAPGTC